MAPQLPIRCWERAAAAAQPLCQQLQIWQLGSAAPRRCCRHQQAEPVAPPRALPDLRHEAGRSAAAAGGLRCPWGRSLAAGSADRCVGAGEVAALVRGVHAQTFRARTSSPRRRSMCTGSPLLLSHTHPSSRRPPTWYTDCAPNMVLCMLCTSDASSSKSPAGAVCVWGGGGQRSGRCSTQVGMQSGEQRKRLVCQKQWQRQQRPRVANTRPQAPSRTLAPAVVPAAQRVGVAAACVIGRRVASSGGARDAQLGGQRAWARQRRSRAGGGESRAGHFGAAWDCRSAASCCSFRCCVGRASRPPSQQPCLMPPLLALHLGTARLQWSPLPPPAPCPPIH